MGIPLIKNIKKNINNFGKNIIGGLTAIAETTDKTLSAPNAQIDALSQKPTVSQLLFYRYAEEVKTEDGAKRTIYTMDDGRKGFIIEVQPPTFLGEENERDMFQFFNSLIVPDIVVHINTFASRNIDNVLRAYENIHSLKDINVKRRDILQELIKYRIEAMRNWVNEPMGKNGVKLRNFVNTISVLFSPETDIDDILDTYINTENILVNYNPVDFEPKNLIAIVSEYLRPDELITDKFNDIHQRMNFQMSKGSKIKLDKKNGNFKVGDKWHGVTLTTDRFPRELSAFEFQSAFFDPFGADYKMALPCPFVCSLVISFDDIKETTKKVLDKAKWNIGQIKRVTEEREKKDPIIKDKREENENISNYIQKRNEYPLKAQWTLTVFDKSENELKKNCRLIKKKFEEISEDGEGWILKEESFSPVSYQSFLMGLPLQYSKLVNDNLKRFVIVFKSNNAAIAPLVNGNSGMGMPVMLFPDRTGQIIPIDFFASKKNYNVIIIGPSGSGKSFLMNTITVDNFTRGALIRTIDIGDSYKGVTNAFGGKFVEATEDNPICLNFFTKIATEIVEIGGEKVEQVHGDELTTIVPLIGRMMGLNLRSSHSENADEFANAGLKALVSLLEEAIQVSYQRQQRYAGLQTIWEYLIELKNSLEESGNEELVKWLSLVTVGLHDYVERTTEGGKTFRGKNYNFFNGVNNLEFDNDLFTFEMEKLTKKGDDIVEIVSMAVLHQMANEAYFVKNRKKQYGLDETARLLQRVIFADFVDDFSRRIRKYGGVFILITQYMADFFFNKSTETLFTGTSFKFFLEQEDESVEDASDTGKLTLNDGLIALMKSVKAKTPYYNEVMFKYSNRHMVLLNKVDNFSYWLFTTNDDDKTYINDVQKHYNLEDGEAQWVIGFNKNGLSIEEALEKVVSRRKIGM